MRERASSTHAALSIKSKPGVGTEIALNWPVSIIRKVEQK